jgi:hypothetical protein
MAAPFFAVTRGSFMRQIPGAAGRYRSMWIVLLFLHSEDARALDPDQSLLVYAASIHQTPLQAWGPGAGIYLGDGLFITAAHVAGKAWLRRPKVVINGQEYPTSVVREGDFEHTDLTVLSVDQNLLPLPLRMRRNPICKHPPRPGETVITVEPERIAYSHVLAPNRIPAEVRGFSTVIADVAGTGDSGSGVFDAQGKCLLGIMSRKISQSRTRRDTGKTEVHDIAKYFVPASVISAFVAESIIKAH